MKAEWLANVNGEEYGPFTWDQMLQMTAEGRVTPELPVRRTSDAQWSTASAVPGLLGGSKGAKPPATKGVRPPAAAATIKKAKPLSSGRSVPPVVTAPPSIPSGIPIGSAVATVPAAPPAPAFSLDVQPSASGKMRSVKSVLDDDDEEAKRKSNTPLILGAIGGGVALVAVIVGLTIYITLNRGKQDETLTATNTSAEESAPESAGESNPGESNPGASTIDAGTKSTEPGKKGDTAKKDAGAGTPDAAAQVAVLKSIHDWKNAATLRSLGIGNAKISLSRIWLADAAGSGKEPAAAKEPATKEEPEEKGTTETTESSAAPAEGGKKRVYVELDISNKAGSPLKYKGWNVAKTNVPFMADEQDNILRLVPASETPGVARLTKTDVPGGGTVTEILVFEGPPGSFDALRLVLPQNVFYDKTRNPYFGLKITSDVLKNGPPAAVPAPAGIAGGEPADPLVPGRKVSADPTKPDAPAETTPPPAAATTEPPPKKPSLIDEINRSFEAQEKAGKKMDEGKGKAAAEKTPPAKADEPATDEEPAKKPEPAKKTAPKRKGKK